MYPGPKAVSGSRTDFSRVQLAARSSERKTLSGPEPISNCKNFDKSSTVVSTEATTRMPEHSDPPRVQTTMKRRGHIVVQLADLRSHERNVVRPIVEFRKSPCVLLLAFLLSAQSRRRFGRWQRTDYFSVRKYDHWRVVWVFYCDDDIAVGREIFLQCRITQCLNYVTRRKVDHNGIVLFCSLLSGAPRQLCVCTLGIVRAACGHTGVGIRAKSGR